MSQREAAVALSEFVGGHTPRLGAVVAWGVLWAVATSVEPLVLARLFDEIAGPWRANVPIALAGWVAVALVRAFAIHRRDRAAARAAADVSRDLRRRLADRELRALGPCESLEVTAISGVEGVNSLLYPTLPSLACNLAALAAGALAAWYLDWRVALVFVAAIGPIAWLNARLASRLRRAKSAYMKEIKRLAAEARRFFHPAAHDREHIAVMRARPRVMSRMESITGALRDADEQRLVVGNYYPATTVVGTLLGAAIVGVAILLGGLSLGTQVGFVTLSLRQVDLLVNVVIGIGSFAGQIPHIEMVKEALEVPTERAGGEHPATTRGQLDIRAVSAIYPDGRLGLDGLSLVLRPGERVAVVGKSGGGKTTLTQLVTGSEGFELRGEARLDGRPLDRLELDFLWKTIVRLPQSTWVFPGTVRENLLPPPGATAEDIEWACRLALLHDTITAWPGGYDTEVNGDSMSGGQAQRLGVARALLRMRGARMLVLDEATSALDPETGEQLLENILGYLAGAQIAALVVTHKLPVHPLITRVVVIGDGKAIEEGDPRKLAADPNTAYARLLAARTPSRRREAESAHDER